MSAIIYGIVAFVVVTVFSTFETSAMGHHFPDVTPALSRVQASAGSAG